MVNRNAKRKDKNKVTPHGVPDLIFEFPERFESVDFKVGHVVL